MNRFVTRARCMAVLGLLGLYGESATAGVNDSVFRNGFEGDDFPVGAQISGRVISDPNADGNVSDGLPLAGVAVYLDGNYNGTKDDDEPTQFSDASGNYRFTGLTLGLKHVRQDLQVPNVQTVPTMGVLPAVDRLPDEVFEYLHAADGVGDFDVPYGKNAGPFPPNWSAFLASPAAEPVPVDLVLKPRGVRTRGNGTAATQGSEALTLPMGASLTVRFDEAIIDGAGTDLFLYAYPGGSEAARLSVGSSADTLIDIGEVIFSGSEMPIDLGAFGIVGPVRFVRLLALDNGGAWKGFEITAFEAINLAVVDPGAHIVEVTAIDQVFDDRDFGRAYVDLEPVLTVGITDLVPATPGLLVGEAVQIQINAFDDLGISSLQLTANGQTLTLDPLNAATITPSVAGELLLEAFATDSAGQTTQRDASYYILNADGSDPFNPNSTGQSQTNGPNAPKIKLLSPAAGDSFVDDVPVVATITGNPMSWQLDFALVDQVDPYNLPAADADYQTLASGSGSVFSAPIATLPLASQPDAIYFIRISAQSAGGSTAYFGQVVARNIAPELLRPQVIIESPTQESEVSLAVEVRGSISSTRTVREWFVDLAPRDQVDLQNLGSNAPDGRRIAAGSGLLPTDSLFAVLDATVLNNGSYVLRIVARNDIGLGWVEPLPIEVTGEAKLGRNRIEIDDIAIDLVGFPLKVTRIYDSLRADQIGDFGYGWSLSLQDTDIAETVPTTGFFGVFGATPFRVGARVYVTAPDGRRLGFTFAPVPAQGTAFGIPYRPVFDADPGNYYRLEVPETNRPILGLNSDGSVNLFGSQFPYNPHTYVLIAPNGHRYTSHETKGLLRAEDNNGVRLDFGNSGISHSSGQRLQFIRDGQGRITLIRDPEGNEWTYTYDANGDLAATTDPDMNTVVYSYSSSAAHYLEGIIDPQGRMPRRFEYDPVDGRLVATINENGDRAEAIFDPLGFVGSATDERGFETLFEYDRRGNVTREVDAKGGVKRYTYDDPANPDSETSLIDAEGGSWTYVHDAMGRITRLSTPLTSGGNQRYDVGYDALGNVTSYQDLNNRTDAFTFDTDGNRLSESPADGIDVTFNYGAGGQLLERGIGSNYVLAHEYNANGLPSRQSDTLGYQLELDYLRNGLLSESRDNNGPLAVTHTRGGLLRSQTDSTGAIAELVENADASLTRTNRIGNATRVYLDTEERPTRIDLPEGGSVLTTFDAAGNPASVTDALGNQTQFVHGATNLPEQIIDAVGAMDQFTRDGNGNVTEIIDRNGKRRTFTWDANQRVTFERWFDDGGALLRETEFIYTATRGLSQVDDRIGGVLHRITYSGTLPRISRVTYEMPGQTPWLLQYFWGPAYAAPISLRLGPAVNNVLARIDAEPYAGLSARLEWQHPDSTLNNQIQLNRNPDKTVSRIRRFTGADGGNAVVDTLIEYDAQGQPIALRHQTEGGMLLHPNAAISYTRDAEAQLLSETYAGDSISISYDRDGQLLGAEHSAPSYADETYTYDAAGNRLTSHLAPTMASVNTGNRLDISGNQQWLHDAAGNLIERRDLTSGRVTEFDYDHRNRMVRATGYPAAGAPSDVLVAFEYDYLDRLLYREINGVRTWLIHDRDNLFAEYADAASELSASYFYDPDQLDAHYGVWRADALGERWLFTDTRGSIRGISNASLAMQSYVDYDSYGRLQPGSTPVLDEPLGFAGRYWLAPLGLYENRRRFYAPELGRFTQEDPTRFGGFDFNLYRYARNDPLGFRDPTGEVGASQYIKTLKIIIKFAKDRADEAEEFVEGTLKRPCLIAYAAAYNFGYFEAVAEILRDPTNAVQPPRPQPPLQLEGHGCFLVE